ncbi:TetR/AcrR family transcriptional regulator [Amycolatopsis sp. WQ 127309]|uniref:TetR/AcrR family transcriptional regulator n=1 Tax=Amycolatopsis sp. WQ 127309 TaxID=2932773 RepID=UPI001FF3237A|nr:TetR/AcrR family transcriptional regulator [Amycolatopsis sp. WQ 127309]UOZ07054.1 TetR/AcrR family transcriptional regulator [Amycolatopsis sp. WQ 127309]
MSADAGPRRLRADAERSTARILAAAEEVLAVDANATLERIADAAGLARATVHRRFSSRKVLLEALTGVLNDRYLRGLDQARVATAPPVAALYRLTELLFELKVGSRAIMELTADPATRMTPMSPEVTAGLELLFRRLREAGEITATDTAWCCALYLAVVHEAARLPTDSPALGTAAGEVGARADLTYRTVLAALGGDRPHVEF